MLKMAMVKKVMFGTGQLPTADVGLLVLRVALGGGMALLHGWPKLANYKNNLESFPDPIGVGSALSFILAVFAEFFCGILLALGCFTRLALTQLIATMAVAAFIVHASDPLAKRELALLYLVGYLFLFMSGPGAHSLDRKLLKH
jgi:putative oxidoreductase